MTSITDERGDELMYAGVRISEVVKKNSGIGGVLGLLWFQRELPEYFCKFLELCLIVTADHGPAVSGAHNTIVAARAGKDLVKSFLRVIFYEFFGPSDSISQEKKRFNYIFLS